MPSISSSICYWAKTNLARPLIHTRHIDLADEGDLRWYVRVLRPAVNLDGVYAVLVYALPDSVSVQTKSLGQRTLTHMWWSEDCAVPVCHEEIITLVETVRTCLYYV
jgi:hypothetical protein